MGSPLGLRGYTNPNSLGYETITTRAVPSIDRELT